MLPTISLLLPLALVPATVTAPTPAVAEDVELKFAWPGEGEVVVTEHREQKGKPTEFSYRVAWKTDADTGDLLLESSRVRVATFRGLPTTGEESSEYALANGAILAAIPDVVVGADGKFEKVLEVKKAIEAAKRTAWDLKVRGNDASKRLDTARDRVLFQLKRSSLADQIAVAEERKWNTWVQWWLGFAAPIGEVVEEVTGDLDARQITTTRRGLHRATEKGMDVVEVSMVRVETGAAVVEEARGLMRERQLQFRAGESIRTAVRRIELTGTFEVGTLRPLAVAVADTLEVDSPNRLSPLVDTWRWTYGFAWPDAATKEGGGD